MYCDTTDRKPFWYSHKHAIKFQLHIIYKRKHLFVCLIPLVLVSLIETKKTDKTNHPEDLTVGLTRVSPLPFAPLRPYIKKIITL